MGVLSLGSDMAAPPAPWPPEQAVGFLRCTRLGTVRPEWV